MKRQSGSILLGILIVLVCASTFVVMDQMYNDDDSEYFYPDVPVEDINERSKS